MSCEGEHHHEGGHHGHDHGHDHSHDLEPALHSSLYSQIQFDQVNTLNEAESGSGSAIVRKAWNQRLDNSPVLESDADEQLLMHIPFAGSCKINSIVIRTLDSPSAPRRLKLFRNRDDIDFTVANDLKPTQVIELPRSNDVAEIAVNRALWNTTTSIDLYFEDNHSDGAEDVTQVYYLGFKGDFMALNREPVNVLYEAAANPSDHKMIQGLHDTSQQSLGQ